MKKLMIFEDRPEYVRAAKKFFLTIKNVAVEYVTTLQEAMSKLGETDGALLDIFAPATEEEADRVIKMLEDCIPAFTKAQSNHMETYRRSLEAIKKDASETPVGVVLACMAERMGIPFVITTDLFHHATKVEALYYFAWKHEPHVEWRWQEGLNGVDFSGKEWTKINPCIEKEIASKNTIEYWRQAFEQIKEDL